MGLKEKVLEQILQVCKKPLTLDDMANLLKFKSKLDRKVFARIVRDLVKDGSLIKIGDTFMPFKNTKLIKGVLQGNKRGFAFLIPESDEADVFIPNRSLNGAMHGDKVFIKLVNEETREGEVVQIIDRGITELVGRLELSGGYLFVIPDNDNYFKDIFVPKNKLNGAKVNDKVVVSVYIDEKKQKPAGEILEVLGRKGSNNAEVLSILRSYGFDDKFEQKVINSANEVKFEEDKKRLDLRDLLTITIDGDDAKDFDDAISLIKENNSYKLYVHIADVSNYVTTNGIVDKEAFNRATSVYFPGSVFPMLPEVISNGVCSLRPNEDKMTVTAVMNINKNGEVTKSEFFETITKSNYRMTYNNVTKILEGDKDLANEYKEIVPLLNDMKELADILTEKRNNNGAINFEARECKIVLDEKSHPIKIVPYPITVSNKIIEQFMLLANESVAKYLSDNNYPAVYRVHEVPSDNKLSAFVEFLNAHGYKFDTTQDVTPSLFSDLLEKVKGDKAEKIINKVMLRSMQKAKYTTANLGHFGLSSANYCHFTSPIRRYPDLMVHRILKAVIEGKANKKFMATFANLCSSASAQSTEREISAEKAERDIDDYYKALFMKDKIGEVYNGRISGVIPSGIFVEMDNTVEGFVSIMDLPEDNYAHNEKMFCLAGAKYMYSISDEVEVEVVSVDLDTRSVNMRLVDSPDNHLRIEQKNDKLN